MADESINDVLDAGNVAAAVEQRAAAAAGDQGATETAPQQTATEQTPATTQQGQTPATGTPTTTGTEAEAAANQWASVALPVGHPYLAKGFKTWGDVDKQYASSSAEARRLNEELTRRDQIDQQRIDMLRRYDAALKQARAQSQPTQQQQQQPGAVAQQSAVPGFDSYEHFAAEHKRDPINAYRRLNQAMLLPDVERIINERMGSAVQPLQQNLQQRTQQESQAAYQALGQRLEHYAQEIQTKDPRFAPDGIFAPQVNEWIARHGEHEMAKVQKDPTYNPIDTMRRYILGGMADAVTTQVAAAADKRFANMRGSAGTARPGSGAAAAPKTGGDMRQGLVAIAQNLSTQGIEVPQNAINDMQEMVGQHLRF